MAYSSAKDNVDTVLLQKFLKFLDRPIEEQFEEPKNPKDEMKIIVYLRRLSNFLTNYAYVADVLVLVLKY